MTLPAFVNEVHAPALHQTSVTLDCPPGFPPCASASVAAVTAVVTLVTLVLSSRESLRFERRQ